MEFSKSQFNFTADVVRATLIPWLNLHFGSRCEEFELGCEICRRYKLADDLLRFEGDEYQSLEQEIKTLEECLRWRKELLAKMTLDSSSKMDNNK